MVKSYRKPPRKFKIGQRVAAAAAAEMDQPAPAPEMQTLWKSRKLWTSVLLFAILFVTPGKNSFSFSYLFTHILSTYTILKKGVRFRF